MRSFLTVTVLTLSLAMVSPAFSQNNAPGGQPAGPGGGQAPGAEAGPGALPAAPGGGAQDPNYKMQVSYALGRNFASNLKQGGVDCDVKALLAGINDALTGAPPKLTDEQCGAVLERFSQEMEQKAMTRVQQTAMKNQKEAKEFLAQNGKREGVQTTPSGLQYRVVTQGKGATPTLADTVKCNYKGTLLNGTEFDASARHGGPAEFPVQGVIPGWTEALQKMKVGDKWQLFIPAGLAYGMNPPGPPIEPGSLLVFEIELLDIGKK
jgi:FKBP-type peptidyl-prolyl cis-trans isomerase FklB